MQNKKPFFAFLLVIIMLIGIPLFQGLLFSHQSDGKISREISIDAPFLSTTTKPIKLMFFGYVGCSDVCTPLLQELSRIENSQNFKDLKDHVDIVFINLIPTLDKEQPHLFASYFNDNFIGIHLSRKELMQLDRGLNVFYAQSLTSQSDLDHGDNIYLLSEKANISYQLHALYSTHPLNTKLLLEDIKAKVLELQQGNHT
jgi:protein SCO1/2